MTKSTLAESLAPWLEGDSPEAMGYRMDRRGDFMVSWFEIAHPMRRAFRAGAVTDNRARLKSWVAREAIGPCAEIVERPLSP